MFHLQPRDELVFDNPSNNISIRENSLVDHAFMPTNTLNFSNTTTTNQLRCFQERKADSKNDQCITRKVLHRDIERKRRQEMSQLYDSLRALLPLEHIKGKRSVCDHMHEAANYIKSTHKKVEELSNRRDKLKKLYDLSTSVKAISFINGRDHLSNCTVVLNRVHYGIEILISSDSELGLSRVIAELLERELNVLSCVSTRAKDSFLHKIQAEAADMASLDLSVPQERLTNIMC